MSQTNQPSIYLNNPKSVFGFSVRWKEAMTNDNDSVSNTVGSQPSSAPLTILHSDLKHVVKCIVGGAWRSLDDADISVRPLCGGISNLLFLLETKSLITSSLSSASNAVIVRIFGEGSENIIDRGRENNIIAAFSKLNYVSPTFYGLFENGRIEGFFQGTRSLEPEEMYHPHLMPRIACALSTFNCVDLKSEISNEVLCFQDIDSYFSLISSLRFEDAAKQRSVDNMNIFSHIFEDYKLTKARIETKIKDINNKSVVSCTFKDLGMKFAFENVVSHNDMLSGNILMDTSLNSISLNKKSTGDSSIFDISKSLSISSAVSSSKVDLSGVILIDFEYAGYNYRGYDIGNHFNEYAGFDFLIQELFPKERQRMEFYTHYIYSIIASLPSETPSSSSALNSAIEKGLTSPVIHQESPNGNFVISYPDFDKADSMKEFLQGIDEATMFLSTLPNLFWGTWAIYKASNSAIDFDYIEYATKRFEGYFFIKSLQ